FLEILPDMCGHARALDVAHRIVRVVGLFRHRVDFRNHPAQQIERGTAVASTDFPEATLGELAADDGRDALPKRTGYRGLGIDVRQRQTDVIFVSLRVAHHLRAL